MSALAFFSAPVVVATCIATVVALIRRQSPGQAAFLAGGICVGLGFAFGLADDVFANQSSTCDAFCGNGGRVFFVLLFTLYGVDVALPATFVTAIVVATIRRLAR